MLRSIVVSFGLGAALLAGPLAAQEFEIGPRLGYVKFKEVTGIENAAMMGVDTRYKLGSHLAVGFRLDVARPGTDGQYFSAEMTFSDTTLVMQVRQPLTIIQYMATGEFETGGSFSLFANGGAGGYSIKMDPEATTGVNSVTEWAFAVGGGIRLRTGGGTSVRLEVQDLIYTNFNRNNLNPVEPRFAPVRFPDVVPLQPNYQGSAHNIYGAISFIFTPGGR
jgi:hypothetical protein